MVVGEIPYSREFTFIAAIGAGTTLGCPIPLLYELAVETIYGHPIPEGVGVGLLTFLSQTVQVAMQIVRLLCSLAAEGKCCHILTVWIILNFVFGSLVPTVYLPCPLLLG